MSRAWKLKIIHFVARKIGVPITVHQSFWKNGTKESIVGVLNVTPPCSRSVHVEDDNLVHRFSQP